MAWGTINVQWKPVITTAPWHLWYLHLPSVASNQIKKTPKRHHFHVCKRSLPRLASRPCLVLTANGLSKWPIAQPLCNCDQISHGSSNPIRSCLRALRSLRSVMDARLRNPPIARTYASGLMNDMLAVRWCCTSPVQRLIPYLRWFTHARRRRQT